MHNAEREAYITTLEQENSRLQKSVECALARKQTFADELFEVTQKFKNVELRLQLFERFSREVTDILEQLGNHLKPVRDHFHL